jgi:prepilin-type N-terminal cleavage/methylation domain-containing protein
MDGCFPQHVLGGPQGRTLLTMRSRQQGMSLIEIFVTLAIVALVMGLVAPNMAIWIQNLQLRNAADAVLAGVQQA